MPAVPSACQAIADQVTALEAQYTNLATQAQALVGQPAWVALGQLGDLRVELASQRNTLAQCVATHSAALTGSVVVIDASAGGPAGAQTATLWDLGEVGPMTSEVSPVQAGAFGFQGPLPAQGVITVQTAGVAGLTGLDFRSGVLAGPLTGQTPRIEIVLGPAMSLSAQVVSDWAASVQIAPQSIAPFSGVNTSGTSLEISVGSLGVSLAADVISITANGAISGGILGGSSPMSIAASIGVTPASAPNGSDIITISLVGANPIQATVAPGGLLSSLAGAIGSLIAPVIGPLILDSMNQWANQAVGDGIAAGFALGTLPAGSRISLRQIKIDSTGITFQPAVGLIGTGLSSFQPAPLPAP